MEVDDAWIPTDRSSDYPVEPGLSQRNALACSLEPEPEPVQSVHPTLVLGAVVCKWRGGTELGCFDAQSSRTLTDGISPMPLIPTNQSPPMQRNSIIAQDMSSITFLNIRLRRPLRPAESETRLYCSTRRKPRTRQHSSVTACATDCPHFPEKKDTGPPRHSPPGPPAEAVSFPGPISKPRLVRPLSTWAATIRSPRERDARVAFTAPRCAGLQIRTEQLSLLP